MYQGHPSHMVQGAPMSHVQQQMPPPQGNPQHVVSAPLMQVGSVPDMLDRLKAEYDKMAQESRAIVAQRDEYERRLEDQIREVKSLQQALYDLERAHQQAKQGYEDEIARLWKQLRAQQGNSPAVNAGMVAGMPPDGSNGARPGPPRPKLPDTNLLPGQLAPGSQPGYLPPPPGHVMQPGPAMARGPDPSPQGHAGHPGHPHQPPPQHQGQQYPPRPAGGQNPGGHPGHSVSPYQHPVQQGMPMNPNMPPQQQGPPQGLPQGQPHGPPQIQPHGPPQGQPPVYPAPAQQGQQQPPPPQPQAQQQEMPPPMQQQQQPPRPMSAPQNGGSTAPAPVQPSSAQQPSPSTQPAKPSVSPNAKPEPLPAMHVESTEEKDWSVVHSRHANEIDIKLRSTMSHDSVVCCVNFSNNARFLATGCNHSAHLYDTSTGKNVKLFDMRRTGAGATDPQADNYVRAVAFSQEVDTDPKYLVTGSEDKSVRLLDIESKSVVHTMTGHQLDIYSVDYARNGRFIASGSGDKTVKLWSAETGECLHTLGAMNSPIDITDGVTSVSISPDGRVVAAGSLDSLLRVWDVETGKLLCKLSGHTNSVYAVTFAPDGKSIASGSLDKTLKIWDLSNAQVSGATRTLTGHKDFVLSVAFDRAGDLLCSGSKDRTVTFWDLRRYAPVTELRGHKNSVISLALSRKDNQFATGSGDCRARLWSWDVNGA